MPFEARDRFLDGVAKIPGRELRTEIDEQFAHILVTFFQTATQQRHDFAHLVQVVAGRGVVEQMQLQLQEIEALRDAVMQSLRDQMTFLRNRKLTGGRRQPMVLQSRAKMSAERLEQPRLGWQHRAFVTKVQRERAERNRSRRYRTQ